MLHLHGNCLNWLYAHIASKQNVHKPRHTSIAVVGRWYGKGGVHASREWGLITTCEPGRGLPYTLRQFFYAHKFVQFALA